MVVHARTHDDCHECELSDMSNVKIRSRQHPNSIWYAHHFFSNMYRLIIASADSHTATMAPSRALLLRRITSATVAPCLRPSTRLLTTSVTKIRRTQLAPALQYGLSRQSEFSAPRTRSYSESASAAPEAPDYLNEAELHVFNKMKAELEPVKLEVCNTSRPSCLRRLHMRGDTRTSRQ